MRAAGAESDPWAGLHASCRTFLDAIRDPGVQRILLLDGPSVLGLAAMRDIEDEAFAGAAAALGGVEADGLLRPRDAVAPAPAEPGLTRRRAPGLPSRRPS